MVLVPLIGGVALLVALVVWEARTPEPMVPLGLFRRRNFAAGNLTTLSLYGGLAVTTFLLVVFIQQVGGYTPIEAGLATAAGDIDAVPVLATVRRARGPDRTKAADGVRADRRGLRTATADARRGERGLRRGPSCRGCSSSGSGWRRPWPR